MREVIESFGSFAEWRAWLEKNPWAYDPAYIEAVVADIARTGFADPLFGYVPPPELVIGDQNYREGIVAKNLNSRLRGVCHVLAGELLAKGPSLRVYAPEWVSPFAQMLKSVVDFQGSEYLPTEAERAKHSTIQHQDVMALTYPDATFDAYITNEVMEHIPAIQPALVEAHRVLKPSGVFFGTFPMAYMAEESIRKTEIVDGKLVHLMPAEYHGNPIDPSGGSLVFTIPAWDIVDQARAAGFHDPRIMFISSRRHAILGAEIAGILVFVARREPN